MKKSILTIALLLSLSACAPTQDINVMNSRIQQQEQTIQQLNSQLSGVQPAQADTWSQVQSLRQEVAILRGELNNLVSSLGNSGSSSSFGQQLAKHQRALEQIEIQFALDLGIKEADPATNLQQNIAGGMNQQMPNQAGQMGQVQGQVGTQMNPVPNQPVTQAPGSNLNIVSSTPSQQPTQVTQSPATNADMAQALYDAGMNAFNARKYQEGLNSFTDFTKTYPKHKLVSNAWFWQGECYYQLGNYAAAAVSYEEVISKFPSSQKAPASYLKQGMAFSKSGKNDAAKIRLDELIKKYPKSPEAARAATTLKELK